MKQFPVVLLLLLLTVAGLAGIGVPAVAQQKIFVVEITGEVDLGLPPYVGRVISDATEQKATAIVFHINTFGGRVDAATEVKDAILNSTIPTVAFIDKRAISAGALIALSCQKIVMTPGGAIGAATPVYQSGEKASEKVVSYMRGEMRATAERHKRNPDIAAAMVDENFALPDSSLKKSGQLLTLTTQEAQSVGYCDLEAEHLDSALASLGYANIEYQRPQQTWSEQLVKFLTNPVVSSLLIMIGLAGIFYGVKTGHLGTVTGVGIAAIALFFGAQYLVDLASAIEVLMFVAGVVLLAVEIFIIPGFGVTGIMGGLLMIGSLFLALIGRFDLVSYDSLTVPLYTLAASLVGLGVLVGLMIKYLPQSSAFNKFVLQATQRSDEGYVSGPDYSALLGATGQAMTTLRPAGTALFNSSRFDVITEGDYISAGEPVAVVKVEGRKIIVRRTTAGTA